MQYRKPDLKNRKTVGIVLAVYNGEYFLVQQLESIALQDYQGWDLYARDDDSNDDSQAIVKKHSEKEGRFHVLMNGKGNMGARDNFALLINMKELTSYGYVAFSDQDDVWQNNKLSVQLDAMRKMEEEFPESALLIHSDMAVVDASLMMIAPSFLAYQGIKHEKIYPLKVLLAQNFVTGCTVMVNRKLLDIALPIPEEALMHDWWLALCAAVFGHIGFIDKPLVKYRQHGDNEVGAKHIGDFLNPITGKWKKRWLEGRENLFQSMKQAEALAERIRKHEPENPNLALVEAYADLQGASRWQRIKKIQQLGVHAQSNSRQALLLSRLLLTSKTKYD